MTRPMSLLPGFFFFVLFFNFLGGSGGCGYDGGSGYDGVGDCVFFFFYFIRLHRGLV